MACSLGLESGELLEAGDLLVDRRVPRLLRRQIFLHPREVRALQDEEEPDQHQHDEARADHHQGELPRLRPLADLGGKEVDLAHAGLPGMASPIATARTGSASFSARSSSSSFGTARWKT